MPVTEPDGTDGWPEALIFLISLVVTWAYVVAIVWLIVHDSGGN